MTSSSTSSSKIFFTAAAASTVTALSCWLVQQKWSSSKNARIPSELRKSPFAKELQLAVTLAQKAGSNMKGYLDAKGTTAETAYDLGIETKSNDHDFCTQVDVENEHMIMEGIYKVFPSHKIIGEETVGKGAIPKLTNDPTWIIDPIDGTTNFSQGLFLTCVSIGFCVGGKPVMGVIYCPATEEWYLSVKGHGAFRNGVRIEQHHPKTSLATSVVIAEFGYCRKDHEIKAMVGAVAKVLGKCRGIRQFGTGVIDLAYVATGRVDIVYSGVANEGWKPWDYCAGLVLCQEAGCIMETLEQKPGEDFDMYGRSIICGVSRPLVDELRTLLNESK